MKVPSLPVDKFIDPEAKDVSEGGRSFLDVLTNEMQTNLSDEGFVIPSQSAANIATIQANTSQNGKQTLLQGTMLYDSTNNLLKVAVNTGSTVVFKTVTVS